MSSPNSTPGSTPPFSSSLTTTETVGRSAQEALSPAPLSSRNLEVTSGTPVPEASQDRMFTKKKKAPSLRRPQTVITVAVGPEDAKESFIVHKDIICHHSTYFAKAFNGNHVESKTQTMRLPDVDSDTFGLLVEWFYTQKIDIDPQDRDTNLLLLAQLWTLGHRFGMPTLQNSIMDNLRPLVECIEGDGLKEFLHYVYTTKGKTMLMRLAADRMAWATSAKGLHVWMSGGHLPEGLLMDIIMSLKKDHVHGLEPTMKFGTFGSAKEYYVRGSEKVVGVKQEK